MSGEGSADDQPPEAAIEPTEDQPPPPEELADELAQQDEAPPTDNKGSESEGENGAEEILEESHDKRWSKRREKVKQRDVPGIDAAYLAMDNETGNEIVWNEVQFSERKNFREQEEKLKSVFDNLIQLEHTNLVKFHKYWTDTKSEKPRIIFITEYMSSGSMSRFLQRARSSGTLLNTKAWKKWATQILSALNYLHSCDPPIVHANLTCNTIFIQQNGLIKIGCVAPNAIHHHVKTFRENLKNMHYVAPEFETITEPTTETDIYAFGICALEMAMTGALQSHCNGGETTTPVTADVIRKALDSLEDPLQKDFIEKCLDPDPQARPTARELLFHPVLFEVHSLKLIAAHVIVKSKYSLHLSEDDLRVGDPSAVAASCKFKEVTYAELTTFQMDLDKFLEEVRNGLYPLIAFAPLARQTTRLNPSASLAAVTGDSRSLLSVAPTQDAPPSPTIGTPTTSRAPLGSIETAGSTTTADESQSTPSRLSVEPTTARDGLLNGVDEGYHTAQSVIGSSGGMAIVTAVPSDRPESRHVIQINATLNGSYLKLLLTLDDLMNRMLTTEITGNDSAEDLASELVRYGFVCEGDTDRVRDALASAIEAYERESSINGGSGRNSRKSSTQQSPPTTFTAAGPASPSSTVTCTAVTSVVSTTEAQVTQAPSVS